MQKDVPPPRTGIGSRAQPAPSDDEGADISQPQIIERKPAAQDPPQLPAWLRPFISFWIKINNDWIFNLAGLLAYNLLMTVFPILLVLLAAAGVIVGSLSPSAQEAFEEWIAAAFPGEVGTVIVHELVVTLTQSVGLLLLVGLFGAFIAGSRLFDCGARGRRHRAGGDSGGGERAARCADSLRSHVRAARGAGGAGGD